MYYIAAAPHPHLVICILYLNMSSDNDLFSKSTRSHVNIKKLVSSLNSLEPGLTYTFLNTAVQPFFLPCPHDLHFFFSKFHRNRAFAATLKSQRNVNVVWKASPVSQQKEAFG